MSTLAAVYGAARARAAARAAEGARADTRAVLGSLGHAHGSLEVISRQIRASTREELVELERVEWTPVPGNDTGDEHAP